MGRSVAIVGMGRAGGSFAVALPTVGWTVAETYGRHDDVSAAAAVADLVLIATPDAAITSVAQSIVPGSAVVAHVAGSLGLNALGPPVESGSMGSASLGAGSLGAGSLGSGSLGSEHSHVAQPVARGHARVAAVHPLMALPDPETGAERLKGGWYATAGDSIVNELVADLGGRHVQVADADRTTYHATAAIAANHLTALLGQVERLAASIGLPAEPFLDLAAGSLESTRALGAAAALTGPASRGDTETVARHLDALPEAERSLYKTLMNEAVRLAGSRTKD